jgi:outer membrane lipoprotein-sorting protein
MTKKNYITIIIALFSASFASAQTAETVLDNYIASIKTDAIKTDFVLKIKERSSKLPQTISGKFTMKADKFIMTMSNMQVFFNGKTQWSYSSDIEEVSITEPTGEELAQTNPMAILYSFRATSNVKFAANNASSSNYVIELTQKSKFADIAKVVVEINKKTGNLVSLKQTNKSGDTMTVTLTNYTKVTNIADADFTFDAKKIKNVSVNDLR